MADIPLLDSGPLGMISHPRARKDHLLDPSSLRIGSTNSCSRQRGLRSATRVDSSEAKTRNRTTRSDARRPWLHSVDGRSVAEGRTVLGGSETIRTARCLRRFARRRRNSCRSGSNSECGCRRDRRERQSTAFETFCQNLSFAGLLVIAFVPDPALSRTLGLHAHTLDR